MAKKQSFEKLTANIVACYVQNHQVPIEQLPELIKQVHLAFSSLEEQNVLNVGDNQKPAVLVEDSIADDFMVCLEDGMSFQSLKRHLKASHNLTPEQYREKWKLPADYPMVAPNYSLKRSRLAKKSGLGQTEDEE